MKAIETKANTRKKVLVIGGNGFIGRHIVKHLEHASAEVVIGTSNHRCGRWKINSRHTPLHKLTDESAWLELLDGIDVVVNSVGILRETLLESYESIHHRAIGALARACAAKDVRIIHVSILGVDSAARSRFVHSKLDGERAVRESGADWLIVRPSLVDGEGGNGAKWFRRMAQWPIHFSPSNALGGFAPIDADDLGEAITRLALQGIPYTLIGNREIELAGDRVMTVLNYLELLRLSDIPAVQVSVPAWIARAISHVCDLIHSTPFSFGHYELLQYRNYPVCNHVSMILGRPPSSVGRSRITTIAPYFMEEGRSCMMRQE